ncbi:MAG: hypothetical protein JW751_31655 [Polyangiaceae bacterium]|nr:hypothetical protein [Polyangiaceae bacterium]
MSCRVGHRLDLEQEGIEVEGCRWETGIGCGWRTRRSQSVTDRLLARIYGILRDDGAMGRAASGGG